MAALLSAGTGSALGLLPLLSNVSSCIQMVSDPTDSQMFSIVPDIFSFLPEREILNATNAETQSDVSYLSGGS